MNCNANANFSVPNKPSYLLAQYFLMMCFTFFSTQTLYERVRNLAIPLFQIGFEGALYILLYTGAVLFPFRFLQIQSNWEWKHVHKTFYIRGLQIALLTKGWIQ